MSQIFNSWRDENAVKNYPFTDNGPPTDGNWTLPLAAIVDANIHPPDTAGGYYLSQLQLDDNGDVRLSIGSLDSATAAVGVWSKILPDLSVVPLYSSNNSPAGVLVVDPVAMADVRIHLLSGEVRFIPSTSAFVVSTWNYTNNPPITEIRDGERVAIGDDLYLVAEDGVRLTVARNGEFPIVFVHAIGDPLARLRECTDEPIPRFIREVVFQHGSKTISCAPNDLGEVFMAVVSRENTDSALRLYSSPGEIQIGFSS
jgi:hypothetical protein